MFDALDNLAEALREEGVVDTHYHVGPELIVRRYDVKMLADVAVPFGATLVLKNHTYPTTPLAALARAQFNARFFGGVVLNRYVGGLNPQAVESARSGNRTHVSSEEPDPSPMVVWMPTVHARSHLQFHGFGFDPRWSGCCTHGDADHTTMAQTTAEEPVIVFDDNGSPAPELIPTLEAIARNNCVLASGHLHAEEVKKLVPLALELGVKRVILTHPHYPSIRLSDDDLKMLSRHPEVFIEHCFAIHTQDGVPLEILMRNRSGSPGPSRFCCRRISARCRAIRSLTGRCAMPRRWQACSRERCPVLDFLRCSPAMGGVRSGSPSASGQSPVAAAACGDDGDDDQPGQQQPDAGADAEGVQHGEQQHQEQRRAPDARHIGLAAGDRGAADDHDGDRGQQIFVADVDIGAAEIAGEQCAVEAAERAGQRVGQEADAPDRNAGEPGGARCSGRWRATERP